MYEIVDRHMPHAIGIHISGDIQDEHFVKLREELAEILDKSAPLNTVFICGEGVSMTPAVLWDDMNFIQGRAGQLGRMALVGGEEWLPMVDIVRDAGFNSRFFTHEDSDAAWGWANTWCSPAGFHMKRYRNTTT